MEFEFSSYRFDKDSGVLVLEYKVDEHNFVEEFCFDPSLFVEYDSQMLERASFFLHIACGVSYWKAFCPAELKMTSGELTDLEARFFTDFYKHGLMQFFYENDLDPEKFAVKFKSDKKLVRSKFESGLLVDSKVLLPIGGGKDSLVSESILNDAGVDFNWFCVKSDRIKEDCAEVSGRDLLSVRRNFSSCLIELNRSGEVFNGHVPISGILAFVELVACVLYGYDTVVMSNEHSSSQANLHWKGFEVNHQYSKSLDFENSFREFVSSSFASVDGALVDYFSLLRGLSEYRIAEIFSKKCTDYFEVFSSCNRNFHLDKSKNLTGSRFCCECEKCAFVFLILSNFVNMDVLIGVFGANLFESKNLLSVYSDMFGLGSKKPWECVGSFEESRHAAKMAMEKGLLTEEMERMVAKFPNDKEFVSVYKKEFGNIPDFLKKFLIKNL